MSSAPVLYRLGRWFFRCSFEQLYSFSVSGEENVPMSGPLLVACNHLSFMDPPAVGAALPRPSWFFARKSLMKGPVSKYILESVQTVPVDRDGDSDIRAMKRVIQLMGQEQCLVMFPEGTRSEDGLPKPIRSGIGWLACRSGAAILPTRIEGSYDAWNRDRALPCLGPTVKVSFAPPLLPSDFDPGKQAGKERFTQAAESINQSLQNFWRG